MLKRLRWLVTGAAMGLGGQVWLKKKARSVSSRYGAAGIAEAAASRAREAFEEGRAAMRQREAELRNGPGGSPDRNRSGSRPGRP